MNGKRMNYQPEKFLYHEDQDQLSILGIYDYLATEKQSEDKIIDLKAKQISGTKIPFPVDIMLEKCRKRMFLNYTEPILNIEKSKALQIFIKFFYYNVVSFDESEDMTLEGRIGEGIHNWLIEAFIGYISEFDIEHALEVLRVANKKSFFILKPELIDVQKYWDYNVQGYYKSNTCEHKIGCQCILQKHFWYLLKQIKYEQQITSFEYKDLDQVYDFLEFSWNKK